MELYSTSTFRPILFDRADIDADPDAVTITVSAPRS
jgi:hypothetical protein